MKAFRPLILLPILLFACKPADEEYMAKLQLEETSKAIRGAFAAGDVDEIMKYHHPDVSKVFNYADDPQNYDEVREALVELTNYNEVSFGEGKVESLIINGSTAILQSRFILKGKVKETGEEWEYKGRTMVISVKYDQSPTGWATIREIVQPAP